VAGALRTASACSLHDERQWSIGEVICTVLGNIAKKPLSDPTWGGTAEQFANEIVVAQYCTEAVHQSTADVETLRDVVRPVTDASEVSTPEAIATLIGVALMEGQASER
jgi:hypothetical protein